MTDNYLNQSSNEIEYIPVKMFRTNMDSIPSYLLPPGYSLQLYKNDSNDDLKWAEITTAAGEFRSVEQALIQFSKDFLNDENKDRLPECLYFLVNAVGKYIGTAMAATDQIDGEEQGSLWWVAIIPEYQGKKLAKPMVSTALQKIAEYSSKCCFETRTTSWRAINMYADFGFAPYMKLENSEKAWKLVSKLCKRNFIENLIDYKEAQ